MREYRRHADVETSLLYITAVFHVPIEKHFISSVALHDAAFWFELSAHTMECRNGLHDNFEYVYSQFLAACLIAS